MNNFDEQEIAKFAQHADAWWDPNGPLKTLHDINPLRLEFIKQQVQLKDKNILDVGCGGGIFAEAMAKEHAKVTGLDLEENLLQVASDHMKKSKLSINYLKTPLDEFSAEPFDAITCMEMLEHVPDPQQIISRCSELLRPGGFLFLSTLNRTLKAYTEAILMAEYILRILPLQTHNVQKFIKPSELAAMIRKAGLELVTITGLAYNPFSRTARFQESVSVNYLVSSFKPL